MTQLLSDYWPTRNNCLDCIKTVAESLSDGVFLAVHQEMRLTRRVYQADNDTATPVGEQELLDNFLEPNLETGIRVMPIVGNSGVGKSHAIRWLDANVRRRDDGIRRHIVRIPKSASLNEVLNRILIDLKDDPRYGKLHTQISEAQLPPTVQVARINLLSELLLVLENEYKEVEAKRRDGNLSIGDKEREAHCRPESLPALLTDSVIKEHFLSEDKDDPGVLTRIARRYIEGTEDSAEPENQFRIEDLQPRGDTADTNKHVREYLRILDMKDHRERAVTILNELVDKALQQMINFGNTSLTELFIKIREELLKDEIELVLLVEDFAVLAGIQGSLLSAFIQEGISEGKRILCTMRTAIAVTEGFFANMDTVMTRAVHVWRITERPFSSDDAAIEIFSNYVGAYLNAARNGQEVLDEAYIDNQDRSLMEWVPRFEIPLDNKAQKRLDAFGYAENGYALFPFNKGLIRQLAEKHLRDGDTFLFDPRKLVNLFLKFTLEEPRDLYQQNQFPPPEYQEFDFGQLHQDILGRLINGISQDMGARLAVLVYFWGNNPKSPSKAASIDAALYEEFALQQVDWGAEPEGPEITEIEKRPPKDTKRKVKESDNYWEKVIESWRSQNQIPQKEALEIRRAVQLALMKAVDWGGEFIESPRTADYNSLLHVRNIFVPYANQGNPDIDNAVCILATPEQLKDLSFLTRFFQEMTALTNYHFIYKSWDYKGGEQDYLHYTSFIGRMVKQFHSKVEKTLYGLHQGSISLLVKGLLIDARMNNIPGGSSDIDSDNLSALLANDLDRPGQEFGGTWDKIAKDRVQARKCMLDLIIRFVTVRQGDGQNILAIDTSQLLAAIQETRKSWMITADEQLDILGKNQVVISFLKALQRSLKSAVSQREESLSKWRASIIEWFGDENFDMNEVHQEMTDVIRAAQQAGVVRPASYTEDKWSAQFLELQSCNLAETLSLVAEAESSDDHGVKLSKLAQVDQLIINKTMEVLNDYEDFLTRTDGNLVQKLETAGVDAEVKAESIIQSLEKINDTWTAIKEAKE